jgi:hypothetical protein
MGPAQVVAVLVRNLAPLAGVLAFGWSIGPFLLMSVFNIAFAIGCIGAVGVTVSQRQFASTTHPSAPGVLADLLRMLCTAGIAAFLFSALFGWVVAVLAIEERASVFDRALLWSVAATIASAVPGLLAQYRHDLALGIGEATRKERDQPAVLVLLMSGGLVFILSGYAARFGNHGLWALAFAVTALFVLRDLRPDLLREAARPR